MDRLSRLVARSVTVGALLVAGAGLAAPVMAQDTATKEKAAKPLAVGDKAPALKVEKFVKGSPVTEFKPGHIYVVEFWATWCGPCVRGMPHLTDVQKKFDGKATIIGVNIWEENKYTDETLAKVQEFVRKKNDVMGYTVAYDGAAKAMDKAYMQAAEQNGIPCAFVVSGDGRVAYIGHPADENFEGTIQKLVDGKFDMESAASDYQNQLEQERKARAEAEKKVDPKVKEARKLMADGRALVEEGKVEEGFAKMDEAAAKSPNFAFGVGMTKFDHWMTKGDYAKASAVANKLIEGPAKDNPMALNQIAWGIVDPEAQIATRDVDTAMKAAQRASELTNNEDGAILDTLARCYWLKGDKAKAVELQKKAIEHADSELKADLEKVLKEYEAGK
ncbi:MAG TPA: redoxin domain-containing protein [Phycisphaerales bacterium]|nr:redoxin domain-containing protein [Phycisphaerales bacterium]